MAQFQILNKEGIAISLNDLDAEIAKFWNKEVDGELFANPMPEVKESKTVTYMEACRENNLNNSLNWYDTIGWNITQLSDNNVSWKAVAEALIRDLVMECVINTENDEITLASVEITKESTLEDITLKTKDRSMVGIVTALELFKPHIELINYLKDQGYQPVKC